MRTIKDTIEQTITNTQSYLWQQRHESSFWTGTPSSSALATATAVFALGSVNRRTYHNLIEGGLHWLKDHQNADGGWGDTAKSQSNLNATLLCLSSFSVSDGSFTYNKAMAKAEAWVERHVGSRAPKDIASAVNRTCGNNRSFSAPILMMCAMAKRLGPKTTGWQYVKPLPFELAALPRQRFHALRLPALIAIGQARFHVKKPRSPIKRKLRQACIPKTLNILKSLQPKNGGFLEATPLTAMIVMSLARCGQVNHEIVTKGAHFLVDSVRDDGSWPINTSLATTVTTLAVNAMTDGIPSGTGRLTVTRDWLLTQQHQVHANTYAAPGAWAWSDQPGAVPNGDSTAGALIALHRLSPNAQRSQAAAAHGIQWLIDLQNKDGGMPAFGKGRTNRSFDPSCPDITAHVLGAMGCWVDNLPKRLKQRTLKAMQRGLIYLKSTQDEQGFWTTLWFGHEQTLSQKNPVYGTSRVISHLGHVPQSLKGCMNGELIRACEWLISVQHPKGPWGGDMAIRPSVEESALAVDALATSLISHDLLLFDNQTTAIQMAVVKGAAWIAKATRRGTAFDPSPIGLYFTRLWYHEALYPVTFSLSALNKAKLMLKLRIPVQKRQKTNIVELPAKTGRKSKSAKSSDVMAL